MHQQNAPDTSAMLTSCPTNAAGYLSNADRFHTDTAGDEFVSRQDQNRKKQAADDFRRNMVGKFSFARKFSNLCVDRLQNARRIGGFNQKRSKKRKKSIGVNCEKMEAKHKKINH